MRPHARELPELLEAEAAAEPVVAGEEAEVGDGSGCRLVSRLGTPVRVEFLK